MKINLVFDYGTDVISVPDDIGVKIGKVRDHFDKWCYDKDNKITFNRQTRVFSFDGTTFVDWLNKYVLRDSAQAAIIEQATADYDRSLPTLFF